MDIITLSIRKHYTWLSGIADSDMKTLRPSNKCPSLPQCCYVDLQTGVGSGVVLSDFRGHLHKSVGHLLHVCFRYTLSNYFHVAIFYAVVQVLPL